MITIILILLSNLHFSYAADDHCEYFKYCGSASRSTSKSSSQSYPSSSTASSFNPSNISKIKGIGVETLIQPNNSLGFSLASGTGKFGGALISPNLENGFFGNRSVELDSDYLQRRVKKKRYKSGKLSLAVGANLVNKKKFSVDLGVALKRHSEIKKINPGVGISIGAYIFTLGAAVYRDDFKLTFGDATSYSTGIPYSTTYGASSYQEAYNVFTFSVGAKLGGLALDYGRIRSSVKFYPSAYNEISIYSAAYNYKSLLFNMAYRTETSPAPHEKNGAIIFTQNVSDFYFGTQYIFNRHVVVGFGYNTFLLKEISATVTLFL